MEFRTISPRTTDELLEAINQNQGNNFRYGAGFTDLIPELQTQPGNGLIVINLAKLIDHDFTSITPQDDGIRIGALTTMTGLLSNNHIKKFPVLIEAVESFASVQIRSVATVGGNLCTASPAGDISCALVALGGLCEILDMNGQIKTIPLTQFFTGVRTTVLQKNEILRSVLIPHQKSTNRIVSGFIKIGNRNSMEISLASFAYHIMADENGVIVFARAAVGSVAEIIQYTESACDYLMGKILDQMSEKDKDKFADYVLEYANPISDIRASAWYRRQVLWNISKSIF